MREPAREPAHDAALAGRRVLAEALDRAPRSRACSGRFPRWRPRSIGSGARRSSARRSTSTSAGRRPAPVADGLRARGVPFLFATGCDRDALPARYADVPRREKPFEAGAILRALERLIGPAA